MRIAEWATRFVEREGIDDVLSWFDSADSAAVFEHIAPEARPLVVATLYRRAVDQNFRTKFLVVTPNYERALQWQAKLILCGVRHHEITFLPSGLSVLFEDATPEHIALSDRLGALRSLVSHEAGIVIATPQAALERTLPRNLLESAFIDITVGQEIDSDLLLERLKRLGYEQQEPVRQPGGFSRRGGIIDIFATGRETPFRIELFGDQVESIRRFDANSQRSIEPVKRLQISPSRETLLSDTQLDYDDLLSSSIEREAALLNPESALRLRETIAADIQSLRSGAFFDRLDLYRPLLQPDSGCAVDLLSEKDFLFLDEPLEIDAIAARSEEELGQALAARHDRGEILRSTASDFIVPQEQFSVHTPSACLCSLSGYPNWYTATAHVEMEFNSLEPYRSRADALTLTLQNYLNEFFEVVFTTDQPVRAQTVLSKVGFTVGEEPAAGKIALIQGNLGGGFVIPALKLAVVTDAELFGVARLKLPQRRYLEGAPISTVLDLKPGDYVVHITFGIGIFRGLVKREEQGVEREYLFIEYAAPDKLFVPADQLDRIQKFLSPGDERPKINRLTGGDWQRTISKAREEAQEFARDLVKLYAERKSVQRRSFGKDTPWQSEMESTFPYVETPSQMQAIRDVKQDLEVPYPMDRLVCGDVGFGKTEVAIRAAFKVVQDGRQVAILCPTTILSEQHERNFTERLGPFGTRIALVNRYRTAAAKAQINKDLEAGNIDIIIGTHALLGAGIRFKDLGLVAIDEEQKFGVKQKEMLKDLRKEVDVLTLSATPIPRTLSMALMDIRQMSLINDPPPGRLPVRTFVRPFSTEVTREAILRELARGGQVFYVYNRVDSIGHVAERLRRLIPSARIGVGHGQMTEKEIEPIMLGFIHGEIDVLLSTTIIENGIDISNANTLIVENADRLGLSQLYQLRGRVGRSDRQAYAYFLYGDGRAPTETALARLQALKEFSNLGSGYSLAFRDLQIRGAGELLGAKQHGTMLTVGYELYTQLINEAVAALKRSVDAAPGETVKAPNDPLDRMESLPLLEASVPALIPATFIEEEAQRLYFYQRLMSSRSEPELAEVQTEVEDRYGKLPVPAANAFRIVRCRIIARHFGMTKINADQGRILIAFKDRSSLPPRVLSILTQKQRSGFMNREGYVCPYAGNPLDAIELVLDTFTAAFQQFETERESLTTIVHSP